MTTILLARHGETDSNRDLRWQGHADPPLNERGREQARALAEELAGVPLAAIYSSDLRRARETAEIAGERKGLPVHVRADLREVDVGEFTGLTHEEVVGRFPEAARLAEERGWGWEDGESPAQMAERVLAAVHEIAETHAGEQVLVVVHGGNIRAVLAHAEGMDIVAHRRVHSPAENCRLYPVTVENGRIRRLD